MTEMIDKPLIISLSKVLCNASCNNECPYCDKGVCQKIMYNTFENEAKAVLTFLKKSNMLKKWK